ncbi:MAG TPA: hypothetical protein DF383_04965 [Deltaproteobacteria bacterium]|nr:hypothetical protein [Deltaproteobacteria bacterium]
MGTKVIIARRAKRDLQRVPTHIADKLDQWVETVEEEGIHSVRKRPGYHDEPLSGRREGQRSIRLSKAYRAIYEVKNDGQVEFLSVEEVNKHDY